MPTSSRWTIALALGGTGGRDAEAAGGEGAEHGRTLPADGRVRGDARGLVDHDDVVVVVDDAEVGHGDGHDARLLLRRPRHLEPGAAAELVGLRQHAAVHAHAAGVGDVGREGAREAEHLGERGIHPRAVEPVGHRKAARLHVSPSPSRPARRRSSPTRRRSRRRSARRGRLVGGSRRPSRSACCRRSRVPSRRRPTSTSSATPIIIVTMNMSATL